MLVILEIFRQPFTWQRDNLVLPTFEFFVEDEEAVHVGLENDHDSIVMYLLELNEWTRCKFLHSFASIDFLSKQC